MFCGCLSTTLKSIDYYQILHTYMNIVVHGFYSFFIFFFLQNTNFEMIVFGYRYHQIIFIYVNLTYMNYLHWITLYFFFLFFFYIELITIVRAANGTILHFRSSNDPNLVLDFHTTESCDICCRLLFTSNKIIEFLDEGKEIF